METKLPTTKSEKKRKEIVSHKPGVTLEELIMTCRGIVALTGIAVGLSLPIGIFLIAGAVSRGVDEITDRIPLLRGQ